MLTDVEVLIPISLSALLTRLIDDSPFGIAHETIYCPSCLSLPELEILDHVINLPLSEKSLSKIMADGQHGVVRSPDRQEIPEVDQNTSY